MDTPVRILLVEDEPLWQAGIQTLLSSNARLQLIGIADNAETALQLFQEQRPDVVLLDWKIKGNRDGLEVGQCFLEMGLPSERIILISGSSPSTIPPHPFLYVPKGRIADELVTLLEHVT